MILKIFMAGIGGFFGSMLRYILSTFVYKLLGTDFPYGTLAVNILGSFLIGFFMGLVENGLIISPNLRVFIATGFLGGFTTFSSFSYETIELFKERAWISGLANVVYTVLNCLGATWLGGVISRLIIK